MVPAQAGAGGGGDLAPREASRGVATAGVDAFTGVVRACNVRRRRLLDVAIEVILPLWSECTIYTHSRTYATGHKKFATDTNSF